MQKIILVGYGKMAEAIFVACKDHFEICLVGRNEQKMRVLAEKYNSKINITTQGFNEKPLHIEDEIIILAFKPLALNTFCTTGKASLICSILAGTPLEHLKKHYQSLEYIRAMPNIAATFQQSCTAMYGTAPNKIAEEIFKKCGDIVWLLSESKFDAAMALSGCAPAFLAIIAESLCDAGVREGLSREESQKFVLGLFSGFNALISHKHPTFIKEEVSSPAGVSIEGIAFLESHSLRGLLIEAIHKTVLKAQKI